MGLLSNSSTLAQLEDVVSAMSVIIAPMTLLALMLVIVRYFSGAGPEEDRRQRLIESTQRVLAVGVACSLMASVAFVPMAMDYLTANRGQEKLEGTTGSSLSPQNTWSDLWSDIETGGFVTDDADGPVEEAIAGIYNDALDDATTSSRNVGANWIYALKTASASGLGSVDELMADANLKKVMREYGIRDFEDPILYDARFQDAAVEAVRYAENWASNIAGTTPAEVAADFAEVLAGLLSFTG